MLKERVLREAQQIYENQVTGEPIADSAFVSLTAPNVEGLLPKSWSLYFVEMETPSLPAMGNTSEFRLHFNKSGEDVTRYTVEAALEEFLPAIKSGHIVNNIRRSNTGLLIEQTSTADVSEGKIHITEPKRVEGVDGEVYSVISTRVWKDKSLSKHSTTCTMKVTVEWFITADVNDLSSVTDKAIYTWRNPKLQHLESTKPCLPWKSFMLFKPVALQLCTNGDIRIHDRMYEIKKEQDGKGHEFLIGGEYVEVTMLEDVELSVAAKMATDYVTSLKTNLEVVAHRKPWLHVRENPFTGGRAVYAYVPVDRR